MHVEELVEAGDEFGYLLVDLFVETFPIGSVRVVGRFELLSDKARSRKATNPSSLCKVGILILDGIRMVGILAGTG